MQKPFHQFPKNQSLQSLPFRGRFRGGFYSCYTTRPDTIFGVDFMVIAPEHELVEQITTAEQKQAVEEYISLCKEPQ